MTDPSTALTNDLQGKQLGKVVTTSINGGVSSPFPSDSVAPTPSANVTVASPDVREYIYMTGDAASVRFPETGRLGETVFSGNIASVQQNSSSALARVDVDHASSNLNQEVVTRPLMSTGFDSGRGSWLLQGAFTQFAGECGLFEDGIKGNVLLGITNRVPGIGYYRHASKRFTGVEFGEESPEIQWVPTEASEVDSGISLTVGESINLVVGFTSLVFWDGTYYLDGNFGITPDASGGSTTIAQPFWYWRYNPGDGNFTFSERLYSGAIKPVFTIEVGSLFERPQFFEIKVTRTAAKTLKYDLRFVFEETATPYTSTATITNSYVPTSIVPSSLTMTAVRAADSGAIQNMIGYSSLYVTKDAEPNDSAAWAGQGFRLSFDTANSTSWNYSVVPGVAGNAWQLVHDMASAYGLIFNPIAVSLARAGDVGAQYSGSPSGLNITSQVRDMSETVEVVNYDYLHSQDVFDPIQLYQSDTAYSLAIGERQEHTVTTDATFSMLYQPECVTPETARDYKLDPTIGESVYSVYDSGFRSVSPAAWNEGGGFITVEGTGVPGEMKLVIQAPTNPLTTADPPFTISIESSIPSLIISGMGAVARKKTITSYTGAGQGINIKKVGTTYDNPMIATDRMAWEAALLLGNLYGTTPTTVTVNIPDNPAGNMAAPRILHEGGVYLPTQWSRQGNMLNVSSAIRYTSCAEFNEDYAGMTNAEYNAMYAGKNIRYVNISPLQFRSA